MTDQTSTRPLPYMSDAEFHTESLKSMHDANYAGPLNGNRIPWKAPLDPELLAAIRTIVREELRAAKD